MRYIFTAILLVSSPSFVVCQTPETLARLKHNKAERLRQKYIANFLIASRSADRSKIAKARDYVNELTDKEIFAIDKELTRRHRLRVAQARAAQRRARNRYRSRCGYYRYHPYIYYRRW